MPSSTMPVGRPLGRMAARTAHTATNPTSHPSGTRAAGHNDVRARCRGDVGSGVVRAVPAVPSRIGRFTHPPPLEANGTSSTAVLLSLRCSGIAVVQRCRVHLMHVLHVVQRVPKLDRQSKRTVLSLTFLAERCAKGGHDAVGS